MVNPTYSSFLFMSQILGSEGRGKFIVEIVGLRRQDLSAFAIFDKYSNDSTLPQALVFVDSQAWSPPSHRPARFIDLHAVIGKCDGKEVSVKRLTSPRGVNATSTDFSLAGVRVDDATGRLVGRLKEERGEKGGLVRLNAAEAVLIDIGCTEQEQH
jgi:hypothetical protein